MGHKAGKKEKKKKKRERVTGLKRRTRRETVKWNQMTALRFQMGGDIRHPRPPFGGTIIISYALFIIINNASTSAVAYGFNPTASLYIISAC